MNQLTPPSGLNDSIIEIKFVLNGKQQTITASPSRRLIDILRTDLDLTGTKLSCEVGRCGACMVLVDGHAMNSCILMAYQVEGKSIETIESITAADEPLDPLQEAFIEEGALQCGYCTPGMIISLKGFLNEKANPTMTELKEALSGNLCRCTGYGGIYRVLEKITQGDLTKG